jgi:hypothetical protein
MGRARHMAAAVLTEMQFKKIWKSGFNVTI